ncbi:hypothetical protein M0Q97_06680 [Candidatus Dojkabacteria bacterium]|jgi:hypothetical protein|nr:hypothetical protein [Candidatus Dojkabacteria bacterium]
MILDKTVKIKGNGNNLSYYRNLDYDINIGQIIEISTVDLSKNSHIKINVKCDICKTEKNISYYSYCRNIKNTNIYTCSKCSKIKSKETNNKKYGYDYPIQSKQIKEKRKKNNIEKYGVDETLKIQQNILKIQNTKKEKYNDENFNNIQKIQNTKKEKYNDENFNNREKTINTNLQKYGVKNVSENAEIKEKIKETFFKHYNVDNYSKSDIYKKNKDAFLKTKYKDLNLLEISGNTLKFICDKKHVYDIDKDILRNRIIYKTTLCTICNPISSYTNSGHEIQIKNFILESLNNIKSNNRNIIKPLELDIYLPDLKLAFEFNGLYWHNELNKEKNYHLNKTELCEQQGIQLIHIYEDDWLYKQDIVKSMILNKLGETPNKLFARKCEIKEITDNKLIRAFLNDNHIQGYIGSKIKIGLFYDNELISLMTFGDRRIAMGKKSTYIGEFELLRFCNKLNTNVVGGASKLFKYFLKTYNPTEITTYADRSFSQGKLYEMLGFKFVGKNEPNYYYVVDGIRHHRFNYRKDILVKQGFDPNKTEHQIMLERKISRIYDSGNLKFLFKR